MIVKNEGAVIARLLESVAPWIDSYCICDTGSTDSTVDIIREFFSSRDISGVILHEAFQDFGYNRTHALEACYKLSADYLLLLDADMVFWVNPEITKSQFKSMVSAADTHYVFQGSNTFDYKNLRIIRNRIDAVYCGVTHEYLDIPGVINNLVFHKTDVFIQDIGDGGSKSDKFERDIALLKRGLEQKPNHSRYTFYLANSYRDSGQHENAIEQYKRRVEQGGWIEETWSSYYNIGMCYKRKGEPEKALYWWMQAFQFYPDRLENIYEIIRHHRERGDNKLANMFYQAAKPILESKRVKPLDHLFLKRDVYDYLIDYEYTIFGYYCGADRAELAAISMRVLSHDSVPDSIRKTVLSNYKFVCPRLVYSETLDLSGFINDFPKVDGFYSSTPSLVMTSDDELLINTRYVNYIIDNDGAYINNGVSIESRNLLTKIKIDDTGSLDKSWKKTHETWLKHDMANDDFYVGLEDIRLFDNADGTIAYSSNRVLPSRNIVIETGDLDVETGVLKDPIILESLRQRSVEKNWVFASPGTMIYEWSPLVIGEISGSRLEDLREIKTPSCFRGLRGSTNGVFRGDEIWFICHVVSHEKRRHYYHMFVVLEKDTYRVKKYTGLFTFGSIRIEYTLGFVFIEDQVVIGYSSMDRETKVASIPKSVVDDMFITPMKNSPTS
jgi:tetratricopeptide (TPR) repeat protein